MIIMNKKLLTTILASFFLTACGGGSSSNNTSTTPIDHSIADDLIVVTPTTAPIPNPIYTPDPNPTPEIAPDPKPTIKPSGPAVIKPNEPIIFNEDGSITDLDGNILFQGPPLSNGDKIYSDSNLMRNMIISGTTYLTSERGHVFMHTNDSTAEWVNLTAGLTEERIYPLISNVNGDAYITVQYNKENLGKIYKVKDGKLVQIGKSIPYEKQDWINQIKIAKVSSGIMYAYGYKQLHKLDEEHGEWVEIEKEPVQYYFINNEIYRDYAGIYKLNDITFKKINFKYLNEYDLSTSYFNYHEASDDGQVILESGRYDTSLYIFKDEDSTLIPGSKTTGFGGSAVSKDKIYRGNLVDQFIWVTADKGLNWAKVGNGPIPGIQASSFKLIRVINNDVYIQVSKKVFVSEHDMPWKETRLTILPKVLN